MYILNMINILNKKTILEFSEDKEKDAINMFNDFILLNNQDIEIFTKAIKNGVFENDINLCKYMYLEKDGEIIANVEFDFTHEIWSYYI